MPRMQRIERSHLEAAADLGAGPWARFWRVTVPLSLPGALATFFMVFIPTVGEYVTPSLVGGTEGIMYGNIIQGFFTRSANWPLGSAMAMIMLVADPGPGGRRAAPGRPAPGVGMTAATERARRSAIGVGRTRVPLGCVLRGHAGPALPADRHPVRLLLQRGHEPVLPARGFTLDWYAARRSTTRPLLEAARNSLLVGIASATLATVLGCWWPSPCSASASADARALLGLAGLPLVVPFVVMGVALLPALRHARRAALAADRGARPHGDRRAVRHADRPRAPVGPRPGARGRRHGPRRDLPDHACGGWSCR